MADKQILDLVDPIPEPLLEGKTKKEQLEISRGYRSFVRLKEQEQSLATQAFLTSAPLEQKLPKPHRRIPAKNVHSTVRINIPKALSALKTSQESSVALSGTASSGPPQHLLAATSGLKPRRLTALDATATINKNDPLSTVELDASTIKNMSPSERIALLYTPTANIRTTGRNAQMRSYEFQVSFRNVEPPPAPAPPVRLEHRGVPGKDPALSHFLALDEFDNVEFEAMSGPEWVKLGAEEGGTPARSRFLSDDGKGEVWAPCRVVSYDEVTNCYHIVWNHNGNTKAVKRLNIIFDAEDEMLWQQRVEQAGELRAAAEADIRLHLYIEGMDDSLVTPIDEDQVDHILSLVASEFPLQHLHVVEKCITEMRSTYSFGLKRAVHEYVFRSPEEQARLSALHFVPRPSLGEASLDTMLATIDTPSPHFAQSRAYIEQNLFQVHALLAPTLNAIHTRWNQFEEGLLCDTQMKGVMLPCELHVFEELQSRTGGHVSDRLRDDWSSNVHTTISNDLDVHLNFYEDNVERYKKSRMYRFFRMVNVVMTSQLRQLLVGTIENYTSFLAKFRVVVQPDFDIDADRIDELPEDIAERRYWEEQARAVLVRREKERKLIDTANNKKGASDDANKKKQAKKQKTASATEVGATEGGGADGGGGAVEGGAGGEGKTDEADKLPPALEFDFFVNPTPYSGRIVDMTRNANGLDPLFVVRLISNGDAVMYSPLLEEVEDKVKGIFDNFFTYTESIKGVGDLLFPLLQLPPFLLKPLEHHEPVVMEAKEAIHRILLENMQGPRQLQQMFQSFEYILKIEIDQLIESFSTRKPPPALDDYDKTLERLFRDMARIRNRTLNEVKFELIKVECDGIKGSLLRKANEVALALMDLLASQLNEETAAVSTGYGQIHHNIIVEPKTPEELQQLKAYIDGVGTEMSELWDTFQHVTQGNELLQKYRYVTDINDFRHYWKAFEWPKTVQQVLEDSEFKYKEYRNAFQLELRENCQKLTDDISALNSQVEKLAQFGDDARAEEYYEQVKILEDKIKRYQQDIILYNSREQLFGLPSTQWSHIRDIKATFEPYQILWEVTSNYNSYFEIWMNRPFDNLNGEEVEQLNNDWTRKINQVSKKLKDEGPMQVCAKMKENLDKFRPNIPLIKALRNNLQATHWKQISRLVSQEVSPEGGKSLNDLLKTGLLAHITAIEEISETAAKTNMLESRLAAMEAEWKKTTFDTEPYQSTHKLKASEAIQQMLDEHIMKTQSIMGSPYIRMAANVETKARLWETTLNNIQSILDEWFKCQATWAYLEPIFSSSDIARTLATEAAKFQQVNETWFHIMQGTVNTPQVLNRCQDEKLLPTLTENNVFLDEILKKLQQFLETKRMAFPRFYFISNEELLQMLSDSKDPYLVQPYLSKCFEGIKKIQFHQSLDITAMESAEKEVVPFVKKVNPADFNNAVELWLLAVEASMCDSIRDHVRRAREDYRSRKRLDFILHWPGQVVLAVCQLFWTMEAQEAMLANGVAGLQEYLDKCKQQMDDLVILVRDPSLGEVARCTLEALVVIDVHAKEILAELVQKGVDTPTSFDWLAQLRYTWEDQHLFVKQINAVLQYGYEYLGNTGRLVITPLTDRCYRTLMGALHLNYGGAPEGPAGTGKTETTKDLAKALAKQCVVYNCSDQITYKDMAKLFKGLSQAGAWGCFDEFNRIEVQVLSVIAQQVNTIQEATAQKRSEFMFDGVLIRLKLGCAVFITMNPGYAGRAELPDNLKALFRPVAMMVPNYAMIGEIQLYSYGFLNGKILAEKIVATYKLCSEQLSSQDHYDYGMRAVKTVLTAAGRLKRKYPNEDESILMLRSIQDVNLPKFLAQDVSLFAGIISDLFPGVSLPTPDYVAMTKALQEVGAAMNLQTTEYFLLKCFQTYEMIVVRHGMMLVGHSFGGKTKVLHCLAKALGVMHQLPGKLEQKTRLITMNPKAITMGQLYGKMDVSGEWNDGVLAKAFRTAANDTMPDRKWLVLDGPVDAVWIENMNTVLDDNKKLCLQNGDIIPMSRTMNMIFEVGDLQHASPATVSRCGMVYVEPETLGWRVLIESFVNVLPEMLRESEAFITCFRNLTDWLVEPMLEFVRKQANTAIPQGHSTAVAAFLRLFNCFMQEFDFTDSKPREYEEREVLAKIEGWFVFSLVWGLGGCLYHKDRTGFNAFLVETVSHGAKKNPAFKLSVPLPDKRPLYEVLFIFNKGEASWVDWVDFISDFKIPDGAQYHEIIVPTADTERYNFLMKTFIENNLPCLLVGDTGTGKTIMAKSLLTQRLDKEMFVVNLIQFSAQTSCNQTQELIEARTERRRKGIYGPPINKKMVIFIDDLNMPALEEYGAQPPIELMRQWMDHRGWYNHTKDNVDFREVVDVQFLGAMGPPGGGRNPVTARFTRHFNSIAVPSFDDQTLKKIFSTLMDWIVSRGYPSGMRSLVPSIVNATVDVYQTLIEKLKPTPEKSHYTFNLRDVSKVFQGIAMAAPQRIQEPTKMQRLWVHEMFRALADRFVDVEDTKWFIGVLNDVMQAQLKVSYKSVVPGDAVLFTDFMTENRVYEEVDDLRTARKVLEDHLEYYNQNNRVGNMDLVIFNYVIEHVARLCRILKQPFGNALLIGVGGSGRTSCTKLAAKIEDYEYTTIVMTKEYRRGDFLDDIKRVLMKAGKDGIPVAFTLTDTQIVDDSFLEDICNLLNTGEVPGLIESEDVESIGIALKNVARELGREMSRDGLNALFIERCRINMHIVLAFSPVGKTLRDRLRKFPSLVNCTTIDWFREWPEEGLRNVASRFLSEVDLDDTLRASIADCFVNFQEMVRMLGIKYLEEARQSTYVTPTSYLELLGTFKTLLTRKRAELTSMRNRYDGGLEQLKKTEEDVELMSQELEIMKPQLKRKAKETEDLIGTIEQESAEAEKIRAKVAIEEAAATKTANKSRQIKEDCDAKVREAQPKLDEAQQAATSLDSGELREMKALQKPPEKVKFVIEAVCNLLGGIYKPKAVRDPQTGKMSFPWWDHAKAVLMNDKFKQTLINFDVDTCAESNIVDVQKYIKHKDFDPKTIGSTSTACIGLVKYVIAMEEFYTLNKLVKPLKAAQEVAEKEFDVANETLKVKMAELALVDDQLNKKKAHLDRVKKEKQDLQDKVSETDTKLQRAVKLIEGLGGEKDRYLVESARLAAEYVNVVGDVVLSSGVVAYLGPFQKKYREEALKGWEKMCKDKAIPCTSPFVFEKFLGDAIKIQEWKLCKLPADSFSVDNAIIMSNARRWPLFIDPQQQANQWIRRMAGDKLVVVRPTEGEYARSIAMAVRSGNPVLLENVEEDLDPVLENLLLKRVVREGTGYTITIGDAVEYNENFRFYITTKLPRPHYRPEVSTKVALINFMITPVGLEDQLLQEVMWFERRDVEERKRQLTVEAADNKATLKKTEDTILHLLSSDGNLLDNESAIQELDRAKVQSDKVAARQQDIEATERASEKARQQFVPVARLGASLFFCVTELSNIDPMYQYSLQFYISLFVAALSESERAEDVIGRIKNITSTFQRSLYVNICRSLFAKDQLLFSFTMCLKIFDVDPAEVRWLLMSGFEQDKGLTPNPCKDWLPDMNWKFIWRASTQLPALSKLDKLVVQHQEELKTFFQSTNPLSVPLPGELGELSEVRRLVLVRCLRTDKIVSAVTSYVQDKLGAEYVEPPLFNLENICAELQDNSAVPIIFVLSPGADPNSEFDRVADLKGMSGKRAAKLSLGQGQDKPARILIDEARRQGSWVLLQNCHLFSDFMPTLARIIEDYTRGTDAPHADFRLWLTSLPSEAFPVSVLQNGVKLVQEPPKGLKSNLLRSYLSDPIADAKFFSACNKPEAWRKLLFGLCFFHSLVQERRKFGPLGWNIPYEFNDTDMRISVRQLQMFINENAEIPYEAVTYLTGHCNYGGRVTDDFDRRCLMATLGCFFTTEILDDAYRFSRNAPEYFAPPHGDYDSYVAFIRGLPLSQRPEVFGLHSNADITKDEREARQLMDATLATQPRESSGKSETLDPKTLVLRLAQDVVSRVPKPFDTEEVQAKYPINYSQSMNTVLLQELIRYNRLIVVVRKSLIEVQQAIRGEVVMSADLEQVLNSMYDGRVPNLWKKRSYPSLKPFGSYIADLIARIQFLQKWIESGPPPVFWVSGFFFTQSFLTGVMQNYARKYTVEIDKLRWDFTVMHDAQYAAAPEDGCYINGLFLEGAGWDHEHKLLCESKPKELFISFPILYLLPRKPEDLPGDPAYDCPTYKTTDRRGVLSTTGHSTNFVMVIRLPRDFHHTSEHWVLRGAALFTQLEY